MAAAMAWLAMTKVIFGYVIPVMLLVSIFLLIIPAFRIPAKRSVLIFLLSFVFCLPWLLYTWRLTDKFFYWTNSGGMSLYTMSTPYANELGNWETIPVLKSNPNRQAFIDSILKLKPLEKDEAYKTAAIENIKKHPGKFFSNWKANVGRLLFNYPFSRARQSIQSFNTIIPNMFVVVLVILTFPFCMVRYKRFSGGMVMIFLFFVIYFFGSSLVSAYPRMFYVTMPFWFLFISYIFGNIISVRLKQD